MLTRLIGTICIAFTLLLAAPVAPAQAPSMNDMMKKAANASKKKSAAQKQTPANKSTGQETARKSTGKTTSSSTRTQIPTEREVIVKETELSIVEDLDTKGSSVIIIEEKKEPVKEEVFTAVEQMPSFPGGEAALMRYVAEHIMYPTMAAECGIQGRVIVKFVVRKDGSVGDVQVVRGVDPDLDKEARRVIKTLPKFNPGRNNGQPIAVYYTLPVNFRLQR